MKAENTVRLGALRNAKKYIIEAKTAGPEIAELPDADVLKIISKLAKQGADSPRSSQSRTAHDLSAEELAQVAVYQSSCPAYARKSWSRGQGRDRPGRRRR